MTATAETTTPRRKRRKTRVPRITVRGLRLGTGLVLMTYVTMHLINHMVGLISLAALEDARLVFLALWRNPVGQTLLLGSLLIHLALAYVAIYQRRRFLSMRWPGVAQLLFGLAIPPLLLIHMLGTGFAHNMFGVDDTYQMVLLALWVDGGGIRQIVVLTVVWVHGCLGMHLWLRLRPWYATWAPALLTGAILTPVLATLGYIAAGRDVAALAAQPGWRAAYYAEINLPPFEELAVLYTVERWILVGLLLLLGATLLARLARTLVERRHGVVRVRYADGPEIAFPRGPTLLDVSRFNDVPHAAVCGGRGRCSTCRVRVTDGADDLPPPSPSEQRVLERISAAPDVRLACQIAPERDLTVTRLLPPMASARDGFGRSDVHQGQERDIAILFADIRGFTTLAEHKLPYDVVFVLNRYFRVMGEAVEGAGGRLDKFIGDGVMALFGVDTPSRLAGGQAINAARDMSAKLQALNDELKADLPAPLRIGIGIHAGRAIVGEMGYAHATGVTAIGDAVNTASRLEQMTKQYGAQLVLSERLAELAGIELDAFDAAEVEVRGRSEPLAIRIVPDAADLPEPPVARRPARRPARAARG